MEIIAGIDIPLWGLLLSVAAILGYIYSTWTFNTWTKQGIPGARPWPLFGTFLSAMLYGGFPMLDMHLVKKYGKVSGSFRNRVPILDVADPEMLRLTMVKDFNSMPNRQDISFGTIFDCFMTALSDDHWRHVRSSLSPTFTSGKLKLLKARIDDCADQLMKHLEATNGEAFDVKKACGGYTMDTISSTAFGVKVDSQEDPDHPMLINANRVMGTARASGVIGHIRSALRIMAFLFLPSFALRLLTKFRIGLFDLEALEYFEKVTGQIVSGRTTEETKQKDFVQLCIDHLIEDPELSDPATQVDKYGRAWSTKGLTKDEVIANAILFYLAGYETTASTMQYIIYELAMNPDIQNRAYEEVMEYKSSDVASYEELSKMEYIDWIIQEAMRIYPAAPRLERLVSKDTVVEGIHLPAGSMVSAMVYAIHHDPELWPEPEKFDPERFSAENREGRHQYAWIPFGLGNRNCIGMRLALLNMKIALVKMLTNFELEPCAETPSKPIKFAKNFTMDPEKPLQVSIKRRKTASD